MQLIDALPFAALRVSTLGDRLKIHWLAYPEARLHCRNRRRT